MHMHTCACAHTHAHTHTRARVLRKIMFSYGLWKHFFLKFLFTPFSLPVLYWLLRSLQIKPKCKDSELRSTNKRKHVTFVCLGLGYLTQYNIFQFHPFTCYVHDFSPYYSRVCDFTKRILSESCAVLSGMTRSLCVISGLIYERVHEGLVLPHRCFVFYSVTGASRSYPSFTAASVSPMKTCEKDLIRLALSPRLERHTSTDLG